MPKIGRTAAAEWAQIVGTLIAAWALLDPPKRWPWIFSMFEVPSTILWLVVVLLFSFTVLNGLNRLRRLESVHAKETETLQSRLAALGEGLREIRESRSQPTPTRSSPTALSQNELLHAGMIWGWTSHDAPPQGPICPIHRRKLGYKSSSNTPTQYANFEDNWLNTSGWFVCPDDDSEMFMVKPDHQRVRTLRATVATRFRSEFGFPQPPPTPPTEEEVRLAREAGERMFGVTISDTGVRKQWSRDEITGMSDTERNGLFERHPSLRLWWQTKPLF